MENPFKYINVSVKNVYTGLFNWEKKKLHNTDVFTILCIPSNDSLYVTMFGWFNWASTATYKKSHQRN